MGYDSVIYIFNYDTYARVITPAFERLTQKGKIEVWLEPYLEHLRVDYPIPGWQQHCSHYSNTGCYRDAWIRALCERCIGAGQFLGRSQTHAGYQSFLADRFGISSDHPLSILLDSLGLRGWERMCPICMDVEGIQGWLDPDETRNLSHWLSSLPLSQYETSFEAMQSQWEAAKTWEWDLASRTESQQKFMLLGLSFLRSMANIAAERSQGILWGNDLSIWDHSPQ